MTSSPRFASLDRPGMTIRTMPLGVVQTNCFVIGCTETGVGAVVDCSAQPEAIKAMIAHDPSPNVEHLLQTHAHIDHVVALGPIKASTQAPIYLHKADLWLYEAAPMQSQMLGLPAIPPLPAPDVFLEEGDTVTVGALTAEVLLLPGHTPGSICFWFKAQQVLFSGDVLFAGSIGRTDLPGGDWDTMRASLKRIMTLPDETLVLSGHGPATTIGRERGSNPFLRM